MKFVDNIFFIAIKKIDLVAPYFFVEKKTGIIKLA